MKIKENEKRISCDFDAAAATMVHKRKYQPDLPGFIFFSSHLLNNQMGTASKASGNSQMVSEPIMLVDVFEYT